MAAPAHAGTAIFTLRVFQTTRQVARR